MNWTTQVMVEAGAHESSEECLRRVLEHFRAGQFQEAERLCRQITLSDPAFPKVAQVWCLLGAACLSMAKFAAAEAPLREALRLKPDFPEAHSNLGTSYAERGLHREAECCFRRAIELKPDYGDACSNLGKVLAVQARFDEAEPMWRQALRWKPGQPSLHVALAQSLVRQQKLAEAAANFQEAIRLAPRSPDVLVSWASALIDEGEIAEAVLRLRDALRLDANHVGTLFTLGQLAREGQYRFSAEEIDGLRGLLADEKLRATERVKLHFCIGAVLNKLGECDEAFSHFHRGNDLKQQGFRQHGTAFDPQAFRRFVDDQIALYTPDLFHGVEGLGHPSETPVFIVGVPRSGTTLVNQILSAHPEISAPGELRDMAVIAEDVRRMANPASRVAEMLPRLDREVVWGLTERYLRTLRRLGGASRRITDKLPENYMLLGLIRVLLPNARIIHCRRDPVDTCLSCYMQDFADVRFSTTLEGLGLYYREYERLMDHWRRVLPSPVFELQYEDLLDRQEAVTRDLITYCGLPWNDKCLEYWKNPRVIQTPSGMQVRQPMYTTLRGRWRKYAAHLGPLLEALGRGREDQLARASSP